MGMISNHSLIRCQMIQPPWPHFEDFNFFVLLFALRLLQALMRQ